MTDHSKIIVSLPFISEIDGWEFWTPSEMMKKFIDGTLERFDFVFSYSTLEHTGLGKTHILKRSLDMT